MDNVDTSHNLYRINKNIEHSRLTVIAHDSISEKTVSNILSNFCDSSDYQNFNDVSNNLTQFLRDVKLQSILYKKKTHVVFDTLKIEVNEMAKLLNFIKYIDVPVILLTRVYFSFHRQQFKIKGGNRPLYEASLVISIVDNIITTEKNKIEKIWED